MRLTQKLDATMWKGMWSEKSKVDAPASYILVKFLDPQIGLFYMPPSNQIINGCGTFTTACDIHTQHAYNRGREKNS